MRSDFEGQNEKRLEVQDGDGPLVVTWGPFDFETKLELEFDHGRDENSTGKVIEGQIKEVGRSLFCSFVGILRAPCRLYVVHRCPWVE